MLHGTSPLVILVIGVVVLVLFGKGKVSSLMGEVGKGITSFKKGMGDGQADIDREAAAAAAATTEVSPTTVAPTTVAKDVTPPDTKDRA